MVQQKTMAKNMNRRKEQAEMLLAILGIIILTAMCLMEPLFLRIILQFIVVFIPGLLLIDLIKRDFNIYEKLVIAMFLGPLLMGFLSFYENMLFGIRINPTNSMATFLITITVLGYMRVKKK